MNLRFQGINLAKSFSDNCRESVGNISGQFVCCLIEVCQDKTAQNIQNHKQIVFSLDFHHIKGWKSGKPCTKKCR